MSDARKGGGREGGEEGYVEAEVMHFTIFQICGAVDRLRLCALTGLMRSGLRDRIAFEQAFTATLSPLLLCRPSLKCSQNRWVIHTQGNRFPLPETGISSSHKAV